MKFLVFLLSIIAVSSTVIHPLAEHEMPEIKAVDFITGFLEGLNEKGDVNKLLECLKGVDKIIDDVIEGLELILTMKPDNVKKGVAKIIGAVTELMIKIKPCSEGFEQILKLIEAIKNIDILKVVLRLLTNPVPYINEIRAAIEAFKNKNFHEAGKRVGTFLYKLFLVKAPILSPEEDPVVVVITSFRGFLSKFTDGKDVNKVEICVNQSYEIAADIKYAIHMIKSIDPENINTLFAAMLSVVDAVKRVILALPYCSETKENLAAIWERIKNIDMGERVQRLVNEFINIIRGISLADEYFKSKEYYKFGIELGKLWYIILFKP